MLCATTSTSIFLILPLIQTTINAISTCETRNGSEFPSHYSLAACAFLADTIFGDSSPDGRVRRQAIAMFNRNASLLDCSVYLAHAMASVALNPTGCETGATAQNVFDARCWRCSALPQLAIRCIRHKCIICPLFERAHDACARLPASPFFLRLPLCPLPARARSAACIPTQDRAHIATRHNDRQE